MDPKESTQFTLKGDRDMNDLRDLFLYPPIFMIILGLSVGLIYRVIDYTQTRQEQ